MLTNYRPWSFLDRRARNRDWGRSGGGMLQVIAAWMGGDEEGTLARLKLVRKALSISRSRSTGTDRQDDG